MDGLVTGHVIAIAFWAGLVAVEVLFEAAGVSGKIDVRSAALLHRWTDRYLELPVLAAVAGTGIALWARMGWDAGVAWKVGAGLGRYHVQPRLLRPRRASLPDRVSLRSQTLHLADDLHGCARFSARVCRALHGRLPRRLVVRGP